jgi:hypothetical protein
MLAASAWQRCYTSVEFETQSHRALTASLGGRRWYCDAYMTSFVPGDIRNQGNLKDIHSIQLWEDKLSVLTVLSAVIPVAYLACRYWKPVHAFGSASATFETELSCPRRRAWRNDTRFHGEQIKITIFGFMASCVRVIVVELHIYCESEAE